ncbi:hypothetical protein QBC46DRAFT_450813 [Diplogelasinospora grovesii]|uniref:Uncharacterized protein n=1 Tax=Diplogelasinospora grovesii TaxID=303347 RepID=A0AAN6N4A9_9PEZI|nr:hypothetical protein QBC46DRAFT_450813 [Diplogelasinospora grovesii]
MYSQARVPCLVLQPLGLRRTLFIELEIDVTPTNGSALYYVSLFDILHCHINRVTYPVRTRPLLDREMLPSAADRFSACLLPPRCSDSASRGGQSGAPNGRAGSFGICLCLKAFGGRTTVPNFRMQLSPDHQRYCNSGTKETSSIIASGRKRGDGAAVASNPTLIARGHSPAHAHETTMGKIWRHVWDEHQDGNCRSSFSVKSRKRRVPYLVSSRLDLGPVNTQNESRPGRSFSAHPTDGAVAILESLALEWLTRSFPKPSAAKVTLVVWRAAVPRDSHLTEPL